MENYLTLAKKPPGNNYLCSAKFYDCTISVCTGVYVCVWGEGAFWCSIGFIHSNKNNKGRQHKKINANGLVIAKLHLLT